MKNTTKRTMVCLLLVCMLLSALPFGALADEAPTTITYDFTGLVTEGTMSPGRYNQVEFGRNWHASMDNKGTLLAHPEYMEYVPEVGADWDLSTLPYRWYIMFTLHGIEAGMYNIDINLVANEVAKSYDAEVYVMPSSTLSKINTSGPMTQMAKMDSLGMINGSKESNTIKNVAFSGDDNGDYYILINAPLNLLPNDGTLGDTSMKLKSIVLTKVEQNLPEPTIAPTLPDFNATEPTDDAGSDNGGFPVVPVVIAAVAVVAVVAVVIVISKKKKNGAE